MKYVVSNKLNHELASSFFIKLSKMKCSAISTMIRVNMTRENENGHELASSFFFIKLSKMKCSVISTMIRVECDARK